MVTRVRRNYRANSFSKNVFEYEIVRVDGDHFYDCTFNNCTLEFAGVEAPSFERCRFNDSEWVFVDHAATTIAFLSQLPHDFGTAGKILFENLFRQLSEQRIETPDRSKVPREHYVATVTPSSLEVTLNDTPENGDSGWFRR